MSFSKRNLSMVNDKLEFHHFEMNTRQFLQYRNDWNEKKIIVLSQHFEGNLKVSDIVISKNNPFNTNDFSLLWLIFLSFAAAFQMKYLMYMKIYKISLGKYIFRLFSELVWVSTFSFILDSLFLQSFDFFLDGDWSRDNFPSMYGKNFHSCRMESNEVDLLVQSEAKVSFRCRESFICAFADS